MSTYKHEQQETWQESDEATEKVEQIILGYVSGTDDQSRPLVSFVYRGIKHQYRALTTGACVATKNQQVALSFVGGALHSPIILGTVYSPLTQMLESLEVATATATATATASQTDETPAASLIDQPVRVDGKNVIIEGAEQVELKCGEASITLTKAGRVLIRGKYVLNRASGVNRIVGGSVQVN